ncbi:MAG TPA: type II toxin-antitoxin system VapC family toxin [Burkholderiaceae bacterium]|nr:type II toxin-antitoxin system VapC family toxin [Burkholderiaceae bacterium]
MRAFDTNLLVRILTRDDAGQVEVIDRLMDQADATGEVFFVPVTVVLELEWVLRSVYKRTKPQMLNALGALLQNASLAIEHHQAVELALDAIERGQGRVDFADALHIGISVTAKHDPLLTFDQGCARLSGAELLR